MRLINADDIIEELTLQAAYCDYTGRKDERVIFERTIDLVNDVQTIDPVPHSKWIWNPDAYDWGLGGWACERCGHVNGDLPRENPPSVPVHAFAASHYCNCCGAKMDKE